MRHWRVLNTQGVEYFISQEDQPPGEEVDEVDRLPDAHKGEKFDPQTRKLVYDPVLEANRTLEPEGHVDAMHLRKAVEAAVVLSGIELTHGVLAEEAAELGISVRELATTVHAKDAAVRAHEKKRRILKEKAK